MFVIKKMPFCCYYIDIKLSDELLIEIEIHISFTQLPLYKKKEVWVMERKRSNGFRHIFTLAFLLFITPAGCSNPAVPIS